IFAARRGGRLQKPERCASFASLFRPLDAVGSTAPAGEQPCPLQEKRGAEKARRASPAGGMGKRYARKVNQTKEAATASIIKISAPLANPFVTDVSQCSNSNSLRRSSRI